MTCYRVLEGAVSFSSRNSAPSRLMTLKNKALSTCCIARYLKTLVIILPHLSCVCLLNAIDRLSVWQSGPRLLRIPHSPHFVSRHDLFFSPPFLPNLFVHLLVLWAVRCICLSAVTRPRGPLEARSGPLYFAADDTGAVLLPRCADLTARVTRCNCELI